MDFALYDQLAERRPTKDWKEVLPLVTQLPDDHISTIYALILHHAELHCDGSIPVTNTAPTPRRTKIKAKEKPVEQSIPYGGKLFESGKGVIFALDNLPDKLKDILLVYIESITA